jgi:hypothetical protein
MNRLLSESRLSNQVREGISHAVGIGLGAPTNFVGHRMIAFGREPNTLVRSSKWVSCAAIIVATFAHRALMWHIFGEHLDATVQSGSWLTWQFLPAKTYLANFVGAILYLQQTPPIPNVIFGAMVHLLEWPVGVARALYVLQAGISACTGVLLFLILERLRCAAWLGLPLALVFVLSCDVYLLEINSFGQLFYESGAMLQGTAACYCLMRSREDASARHAAIAGVLIAAAALTRASFSLLFVPIAAFVLFTQGSRRALIFMVPVVALHGGWVVKNYLVYGYLNPATSSWGGINATFRLNHEAQGKLVQIIGSDRTSWAGPMLSIHGYTGWRLPEDYQRYLPPQARARENEIQKVLKGTNPVKNSIAVRMLSDTYLKALPKLFLEGPEYFSSNFMTAYSIFWQPIANYSAMYTGPVYMDGSDTGSASLVFPLHAQMQSGIWPNKLLPRSTRLAALSLYPIDTLAWWCIHALLPLVIVVSLAQFLAGEEPVLSADLLLLACVFAYGSFLFNAVECRENMRFRLSVEPEIIALSIGLILRSGALLLVIHRAGIALHASRHRGPNRPGSDR